MTTTTPTPTLTSRLREAILRGRKPAPQAQPKTPPWPTPQMARETLGKFCDLLQRMHTARANLDNLAEVDRATTALDLPQIVKEGRELPDLARIAGDFTNAKVAAPATKAALDRMTPEAIRAMQSLDKHRRQRLDFLECELRAAAAPGIPQYLSPSEQEQVFRKDPAWGKLLALRDATKPPSLPLMLCGGEPVLDYIRTAPLTDFQRKAGAPPEWNPAMLAASIRGFISGVDALEQTRPADLNA